MTAFSINELSASISLALKEDGVTMPQPAIAALWREAVTACAVCPPGNGDFIDPLHMFTLFADFSDLLGRSLGRTVEPEGFALDWADLYPNLVSACDGITEVVIRHMSRLSELCEREHGYTPGDVFLKSMQENLAPEVAAAALERDRQKPIIH